MAQLRLFTPSIPPKPEELLADGYIYKNTSANVYISYAEDEEGGFIQVRKGILRIGYTFSARLMADNNKHYGWYSGTIGGPYPISPMNYTPSYPKDMLFESEGAEMAPYASNILFEENTTACKSALIRQTKTLTKLYLAEKGQTVGDVFSTYPAAVRAIDTGGGTATLTVGYAGESNTAFYFVNSDGELITSENGTNVGQHTIPIPSLVLAKTKSLLGPEINGDAEMVFGFMDQRIGIIYALILVTGNASITY